MDTIKTLDPTPFKYFCMTIGELPSSFVDSMSYYEMLAWLCNYLEKTVIPAVNANAMATTELQNLYIELKAYVDNYFDNLDVQTEINNKLDDMAESGELATIISQFLELGTIFTYDTLADMIAAENLQKGSTCQTLGKAELNDGYGAIYKIDEEGDILLDNGLYATMYGNTQGNNYYDEITVTTSRANDADYYVATIPLNDSEGNMIGLYVDEVEGHTLTPLQYADANYTTLTVNAGLGRQDSQDQWKQAAVIANGVILHGDECDTPVPDDRYNYIGFKADRTVLNFPGTTDPEVMLAQGVENAFMTWGQIVVNGVVDINELVDPDQVHPWLNIGVKNDGTLIILASDSRTEHDPGMTITEVANLMLDMGCANVWRCDGGGSTSMVYKGSKQNRNIDENGTKDRGIWVTLNFKKPTIDEQLARAYSMIGEERQLLNKQIRDDIRSEYEPKRSFLACVSVTTGRNIATTGTRFQMQFNDNYRRGDVIQAIRDESQKPIGFTVSKTGLYKIDWLVDIYCKQSNGNRSIRLTDGNGAEISNYSIAYEYMTPTANNEWHHLTASFCVNLQAGANVYFTCEGQTGDDFNRSNAMVEQIGTAA